VTALDEVADPHFWQNAASSGSCDPHLPQNTGNFLSNLPGHGGLGMI
jgi:hypothetical protein